MPTNDIGQTSTTTMGSSVIDFSVASQLPDSESSNGFTFWDYPDAAQNLGFYKTIPEIKSALKVFANRVCGQGYTVDNRTQAILNNITGNGKDTFTTICMSLVIGKKVFGDIHSAVVRSESGNIINLKNLFPMDMRTVFNEQGIIERYEQRNKNKPASKMKTEEVFHLQNDRMDNEIHGVSIIEALAFIIEAKQEALKDERTIKHRELMGILEVDTNDTNKIAEAVTQYVQSVKEKEVLVTIKGTSEIKDNPMTHKERIQWLQYLDNLFYQIIGTPKALVTSEGFTEAGGKAGLLSFEPNEIAEKLELEEQIWSQLGLRVKFNRSPSLLGEAVQTENKNTGQVGIQKNETQVSASRTE